MARFKVILAVLAFMCGCTHPARSFLVGGLTGSGKFQYLLRGNDLRSCRQPFLWQASAKPIKYGELQHCGVLVDDVEEALRFYCGVLGMKDVSHLRPAKLDYPGAFIECGLNQIHLMKLPSMDPREGRPEHGGRDRHLAVTVQDVDVLASKLTENGVVFTMSRSGRRALFCRDPYMNAIEFVEDPNI